MIGVLVTKNQNSNQTSLSTTPTPRPTVKPTSTTSPTTKPAATPKPTTTTKPASTFAPAYSSSAQERPENGHVFYTVGTKSTEYCQLKIVNQHSEDYYIKLVKYLVGDKVVCFYVRGNSTATVDVPSGVYELKMASGSTWYGEKDYFGTYTSYSKDPDSYVFSYDTTPTWLMDILSQRSDNSFWTMINNNTGPSL